MRHSSVSWDWPRAGQLEPHLSSPRHSQEGCALRQASCSGCTPPPCLSPGPRPLPGIPARGGAPGADVSPPQPGPCGQLPSPQGRQLRGDRCCLMPSAAAGNGRLRGLALHLTRMGTPHYVTLGEVPPTPPAGGLPPSLPSLSGHSLVVSSPLTSLGSLLCPPGPMTGRGAAQSQGAQGCLLKQRGAASSEGGQSGGACQGGG